LLHKKWPDRDGLSMAYAIRNLVPLVQLPPRGVWGASARAICTTAEGWLGRSLEADSSLGEMILRYLGAFGPASMRDFQAWSGLNGTREFERLRPRLCIFRDEREQELFDLPGAALPDPDTAAPARFLPEYDNVLLAHADRTRIIHPESGRAKIGEANVLVDGFAAGTWKITRSRNSATLIIRPFERFSRKDSAALTREGTRLLAFLAAEANTRNIEFAEDQSQSEHGI
jgi:hypothetical protein